MCLVGVSKLPDYDKAKFDPLVHRRVLRSRFSEHLSSSGCDLLDQLCVAGYKVLYWVLMWAV